MIRAGALLLGMSSLLLCSCSMVPAFDRPALPIPAQFPQGAGYEGVPAPAQDDAPALGYAELFADPALKALIAQALENNRDLRRVAANIERARALARVQRGALYPQIDAGIDATVRDSGAAASTTSLAADVSTIAYEIDVFGRIRALSDAAEQRAQASEADARAVRLALIGDIAETWLRYASNRSLLHLSEATAAVARKSVELTSARLMGGIAPRTDLRRAETILATAKSDVARFTTAAAQDRNLLELLVGAPVDADRLRESIEAAGGTIGQPPLALDARVLLRRPDIQSAEHALRAANADIGAARAALLPRLSLSALVGLAGGSLDGLFSSGAEVAAAGGSASYPIFRGGAGRASVEATQAQQRALLAAYEKAIQAAYREVADALARRGTIDAQLDADTRRQAASQDAYELSDARYRGGVDSFLQALDAQRDLYAAQRNLVATRLEAARNRVTLYRVLGAEPAPDSAPAAP